jgi:hypothetical protein
MRILFEGNRSQIASKVEYTTGPSINPVAAKQLSQTFSIVIENMKLSSG